MNDKKMNFANIMYSVAFILFITGNFLFAIMLFFAIAYIQKKIGTKRGEGSIGQKNESHNEKPLKQIIKEKLTHLIEEKLMPLLAKIKRGLIAMMVVIVLITIVTTPIVILIEDIMEDLELKCKKDPQCLEAKVRAKAEADAKARAKAKAKAQADAKARAEAKVKAIADAKVRARDETERKLLDIQVACQQKIQQQAAYDYKWGWTGAFSVGGFNDSKGVGGYLLAGDNIKLQTTLGLWVRHSYECFYSPDGRISVKIWRGRIPAGRYSTSR